MEVVEEGVGVGGEEHYPPSDSGKSSPRICAVAVPLIVVHHHDKVFDKVFCFLF